MIGKRGQAATELAIFGSIMLIIVGAMVNYGQTLATQQELEMYAFRRALQLSRARINDNEASRSVGLTVFKEVYPVNLLETGVGKSLVSGSASVNWEPNPNFDSDPEPQDFTTDYWQLGRRMIRDNQLIELPKMKVRRERDTSTIGGFIGYVWEFFTGQGGDSEIFISMPIDQTLTNKVIVSSATEETKENIDNSGQISIGRTAEANENSTLTIVRQSDDKIAGPDRWDRKIVHISYDYPVPGDIAINESGTTRKDKLWETKIK